MDTSDLEERYNDGIVAFPVISKDIPILPRPRAAAPTAEQIRAGHWILTGLLVIGALLLIGCMASVGYAVWWLVF